MGDRIWKKTYLYLSLIAVLSLSQWTVVAGPKKTTQAQKLVCKPFDHQHAAWSRFLEKWVKGDGVNYDGIKKNDAALLKDYLAVLKSVCKKDMNKWTQNQRLAFWINVYNAYTIDLIVKHYPLESIRKIGMLPGDAWSKRSIYLPQIKIKNFSLSHLEHDIIMKQFREPRVHFALVCAARGCPPLLGQAYTADKLEQQLESQTKAFLNDRARNRYDVGSRTLQLSKIFEWYKRDFGKDEQRRLRWIGKYLPELQPHLKKGKKIKIEYLPYDWSLNDK